MQHIKNLLAGIVIGVANTIPGVSGGTMAVVLNMYDKILNAVSLKKLKDNLAFLICLGLGGIIGILAFSKIIVILLNTYPLILNYIFIGLIIGSLPIIFKHAKYSNEQNTIKSWNFIFGIVTFSIMVFLSFAEKGNLTNSSLSDMGGMSTAVAIYLFIAALVSSVAMLLPGISGSLLLLIFGVYAVIMEAIDNFYMPVLLPVAFGVGIGILAGIKLIRELLNRFPQPIYLSILGLMLGSIFPIWPGFSFSIQGVIAILLAIIFGLLAYFSARSK